MNPLRTMLLRMSESPEWRQRMIGWSATRKVVERFMPGDHLDDAVAAARQLNAAGMKVSLNRLGEHVHDEATAENEAEEYVRILERIASESIDAGISVKLSQVGLDLSRDTAESHLWQVLEVAEQHDIFVRIDMEESQYVDATLEIFEELHQRFSRLGVVIQSYLYRSPDDVDRLAEMGVPIRLCKGAYSEPPEVAFPNKRDVDRNYVALLERLITREAIDNGVRPAIATHDVSMIEAAKKLIAERNIESGVEFQMLYGIRRDLQEKLVTDGFPLRVYVSYGPSWYPWFMRRLAERPANLFFFVRHLMR